MCGLCKKAFERKSHLDRHMGTHTSPSNEGGEPSRLSGPVENDRTMPTVNQGAGPSRLSTAWQDSEMHVSTYFLNIIKFS